MLVILMARSSPYVFNLSIDATCFFNITKYKYVNEVHFYVIFLTKKFVLSMTIRIFTARELAKPLNDAQMCGSFFVFIGRWQQKFRL